MNVYAIRAFIKPEQKGGVVFKGHSYKGIVFAKTPTRAKEKTIDLLIKSFSESDADVTKEVITIKECKPYNDFLIPPEKK
ncbi:hypothetical protein [uncultured Draconibacterium sp.]|uniref:hypothetical protein n=1 Tax=uncultured Draconibacterium sp. TaxID=1573823 RepID=UPI0025EB90C6|nr:hypothetical protein [uncultured Draconibacterium sp.]